MTDELNWKQKCRRVAKWLDEFKSTGRDCLPYRSDRAFLVFWHAGVDGWPKYHEDDAAAMRLQRRLPGRIQYITDSWGEKTHWLDVHARSYGWLVAYRYRQGDSFHNAVASGDDSLKKALVLAACELIDMGVEPREVAR